MKFKKINDNPPHYEIEGTIANMNELIKAIESIPDGDCFVEIGGSSYHFPDRRSREYFVLGMDLVFGLLR